MDINDYGTKLHFNQSISAMKGVPYHNEDEVAKVQVTEKLLNQNCWDRDHLELLEKYEGRWLFLRGTSFGWWKVLDATA